MLCHIQEYSHMQSQLHIAIDMLNNEIASINSENCMSTPFLHTEIKRSVAPKGKDKSTVHTLEIKYYYNHLHDGVHPDNITRDKWAKMILKAITYNRSKYNKNEDLPTTPKRSWKFEKKIPKPARINGLTI